MCRFYGFTDDHCLKMLASRFFLMLENIDRLQGQELANLCFVSRAANMTPDGYQTTVSFFENMGAKKVRPPDVELPVADTTSANALKASSSTAKKMVMGIFAQDNRINRKVLNLKENPRRRH